MSRRYDPRRAKTNRNYTVRELAKLFEVWTTTISAWVADGLSPVDRHRPYLFRGGDVKAYIKRRLARAKRPCKPGEIFCVACKAARVPVRNEVIFRPVCHKSANLVGVCPTCEHPMFRRVCLADIGAISKILKIGYEERHDNISGFHSRPHTGKGRAYG
jgi:hypothetical protein